MFRMSLIELQSIVFASRGAAALGLLKMSVMLVAPDFDWVLDVHLDDDLLDALIVQIERGRARPSISRMFHRRLESSVPEAIGSALDGDLRPPSESQRTFATRIAAKLQTSIPEAAWRYRADMSAFLEACVEELSRSSPPNRPRKSSRRG